MRAKAALISGTLMTGLACLLSSYAPALPQQSQDLLEAQEGGRRLPSEEDNRFPGPEMPRLDKEKQRNAILQAKLASSKKDAAELAALAQQLRDEMNKPDFKALSPESVDRLNKIEKLAKKIRDELKVY